MLRRESAALRPARALLAHEDASAAAWLVMDGVPLREVARLLGNSEAMVEKVYGKHAPDYLRRAVNSLSLTGNRLQNKLKLQNG